MIDPAEKLREGDKDAWKNFIEKVSPSLFRLAGRFFKRKEEVEDAVQEAFLRCYKYRNSIKKGLSLDTWARKVTLRVCYDMLEGMKKSQAASLSSLTPEEIEVLRGSLRENTGSTVESSVSLRDIFDKLLDHLSPMDRMVVVLSEIEGFTAKEVGKLLGISTASAKMRRFRAKKQLSKALKELTGDTHGS